MNKYILLILIFNIVLLQDLPCQSIGRIEERTLKGIINIDGRGSGFLVSRTLPSDTSKCRVFLVTNKHMIGNWTLVDPLKPNQSITIYLYSKDAANGVIPVNIPLLDKKNNLLPTVRIHKNPKIDIAVVDITSQIISVKNLDIKYFDISYLLPLEDIATQTSTGMGDQVYAIGYPAGITSTKTNAPIIKSGYISSSLSGNLAINTSLITRANKKVNTIIEGKYFLVDGLIIGGNSGGPIVHPNERKYKVVDGRFQYTNIEIPNLIFGIVSSSLGNTGISVIFSCDHIIEVLNQYKLE